MPRYELTDAASGPTGGDEIEGSVIAFGAAGEVTAWFIATGQVGGIALSGLTLISASAVGDSRRRVLLVDEQATPEQLQILLDVFGACQTAAYYQVPVSHTAGADVECVVIPHRVRLEARAAPSGEDGPGAPAWPGVRWSPAVGAGWIRIVEHDLSWDADGRPASRGQFRCGVSG